MRLISLVRSRLLPALALTAVVSCGGSEGGMTEPEPDPSMILERITVTPAAAEVEIGQTLPLTAILVSQAGTPLTRPVTWTSSDAAVASVDGSGSVTARGAGTATITASADGVSATARITVPPPGPPPVPQNVAATALSGTEIEVRWTDASTAESAFVVERLIEGEYVEVAHVPANATRWVDTGLTPGDTYRYRVRAVGEFGISEPSAYAQATTLIPLGISTGPELPQAFTNIGYVIQFTATGGPSTDYQWTVVGGALPEGATFTTFGRLEGVTTVPDTAVFTLRVTSGPESTERTFTLRIDAPPTGGPFAIDLVYLIEPAADDRADFDAAAARWSDLVTTGLEDYPTAVQAGCGGPALPNGVDDVTIFVRLDSIDGPGGVLGSAGPCRLRGGGASIGLPLTGIMTFDTADVNSLQQRDLFEAVILHEMGHVLGIGTLWDLDIFGYLAGDCTVDPRYTGPEGVAAWHGLGGTGTVPVYEIGEANDGSNCSHWRESVFRTELMTPFLNSSSQNPLSILTVQSLADLGYQVDPSRADAYTLPGASSSPPALLAAPDPAVNLRNDAVRPLWVNMPDGRQIPIERRRR